MRVRKIYCSERLRHEKEERRERRRKS